MSADQPFQLSPSAPAIQIDGMSRTFGSGPKRKVALDGVNLTVKVGEAVIVWPAARNLVANVAAATTALLCGAFVPTSHWPEVVQGTAQVVPLTHIIETVVSALLNQNTSSALRWLALAFGLGAVWLLVGIAFLERFVERGRRTTSSAAKD